MDSISLSWPYQCSISQMVLFDYRYREKDGCYRKIREKTWLILGGKEEMEQAFDPCLVIVYEEALEQPPK